MDVNQNKKADSVKCDTITCNMKVYIIKRIQRKEIKKVLRRIYEMTEQTVITISRQYGSGGKEVAEQLAKKLGVRCYDRQILYLAAEKMGNSEMDIASVLKEAYQTPESHMSGIGPMSIETLPYYNKMYREQAVAILKIAEHESAVFLGRCADAVLKDRANHFSFFIYANEESRRERGKKYYGNISFKEIENEEKARAQYYNKYTGRKWGDPQNYDLMINMSHMEPEAAADLIFQYVEKGRSNTEIR